MIIGSLLLFAAAIYCFRVLFEKDAHPVKRALLALGGAIAFLWGMSLF